MASNDEVDLSVDELVQQLRARVAERRTNGDYPADLEDQLDGHFERIALHRRPPYDFGELRRRSERLGEVSSFGPSRISYATRVPGGAFFHRLIGKLVSRQTAGILAQAQAHADALSSFAEELTEALEHPKFHEHGDLISQLDLIFERLASFERATSGVPAVGALTNRVKALEDEQSRQDFRPWFSNENFEAAFRGTTDEIRERYRDLARAFLDCDGPIVDLGCGRGEFVELLSDLGVDASGVDIDPELVALGQDRGLPVEFGSLVPWLEGRADGDLGGLALIQVVEHISAQDLVEFVTLARDKVQPGGRVVVETVNPQSLYVFAHSFYLDPTHVAPVHPAYLVFLFEQAGFSDVSIEWRSPCPIDDILEVADGESQADKANAANVERLNRLLFAPQDYALIATR